MRVRVVGLVGGADAAANAEAAAGAVRDAVRAGARLVVLPEYASAYRHEGVGAADAQPLDGPFVAALREASAGAVVLAGTLTPVAAAGPGASLTPDTSLAAGGSSCAARAHNTVVALADGALVGTYAKVHLYDAFGDRESDRLDAGDPAAPPLVVDVDGLRVGVLTCYDLRFPESARRLVDAGADVLVVPAAWASGPLKDDHWRTLLRARAIESTCWVVGAPLRGRGLAGDPVVVDPAGVVVGESPRAALPFGGPVDADREPWPASGVTDVLDADADPARVAEVRATNPSLANRRYRVVPA